MISSFNRSYTRYQADRSAIRKLIRRAYLRSARSRLRGTTLDFGCGIGELLEALPAGSKGLEYNQATVEHCRSRGLDVDWYDGEQDGWRLTVIDSSRRFQSMIISHVLEHLDDPMHILNRLLAASIRFGIERVLVIVPGQAGFRIDNTHRTFIDHTMLSRDIVVEGTGYRLLAARYFPGNLRRIGEWFPHHELQVLYTR